MATQNGNGSAEPKVERKPFKKGERERHLELLGKNTLLARKHKTLAKKYQDAAELCLDDLESGGFMLEAQGRLDVGDDDLRAEA